jgi:hypothetical protein
MTGRLRWFVAGVGVGVLATRRLARSPAGAVVADAGASVVRRVRRVVEDVLDDARVDVQRRETRLRELLGVPDTRTSGAPGPGR